MKNLFFLADSGSPIKLKNSREVRKLNDFYEFTICRHVTTSTCIETLVRINIRGLDIVFSIFITPADKSSYFYRKRLNIARIE